MSGEENSETAKNLGKELMVLWASFKELRDKLEDWRVRFVKLEEKIKEKSS